MNKIRYCTPEVITFQWMDSIGFGICATGSDPNGGLCTGNGHDASVDCNLDGNAAKACSNGNLA